MASDDIILSLEGSSASGFSLSLFRSQRLLQEEFYNASQFSDSLLPAIDKILQKNRIPKNSLSALFGTSGPGSFTSIRVVLSSLIAISMGLNIPLYTLDSLKAAALITDSPRVAVALQAYKGELYTAFFEKNNHFKQATPIQVLQPVDFLKKIENQDYCLVGNGMILLQEKYHFSPAKNQKIIAKDYLKSSNIAKYLFCIKNKEQYKNSNPHYIKSPDARLPY